MPAPKRVKAPERIEIDGKPYVMVRTMAKEKGISYQGLLHRIERGQLEGAIKHKPCPTQQEVWYMPADTEIKAKHERAPKDAEQVFPSLHRNSDGVPSPQKLNPDLPEVDCADCPHCDNKKNRCYGLTRDGKMQPDGEVVYSHWWCHRIGRKVKPLGEWLETMDRFTTDMQTAFKRVMEMPKPAAIPAKAKVEDARYEDIKPIPSEKEAFRIVLMELENEAASLDEEAAEIEARFEDIAARSTKVKTAIEALSALEVKESA